MPIELAKSKRSQFYLYVGGLLVMVAAVVAVSARDPSGVSFRIGMVLMTVGAAALLPKRSNALMATVLIWLAPNIARAALQDVELFSPNMLLELPPLLGVALFTDLARHALEELEAENVSQFSHDGVPGEDVDPITGVYDERLLRPALEMELARATRFNRQFALVLVGIDSMRQRFDYRDDEAWEESFIATAKMLRGTRKNIDRVYRYGVSSFAVLLPESGPKDVNGLLRRLSRAARRASPAEGEAGGPLPCHYGATFFPQCATTTDDMLRRAEIVLRIAEKNTTRVQLDGAEAPEMEPPETHRAPEEPELPMTPMLLHPELVPAQLQAEPVPGVYTDYPSAPGTPAPVSQPITFAEPASALQPNAYSEGAPAPQPVVSTQPEPVPAAVDPELESAMAALLKRMDETSEMMRDLRKSA